MADAWAAGVAALRGEPMQRIHSLQQLQVGQRAAPVRRRARDRARARCFARRCFARLPQARELSPSHTMTPPADPHPRSLSTRTPSARSS